MTRTPLADLPPGPELASRLAELFESMANASDAELIDGIVSSGRLKGAAEGWQVALLAEFARRRAVPAPEPTPTGTDAETKTKTGAGTEDDIGARTDDAPEPEAEIAAETTELVVDEFCADEVSCALTLHRNAAQDRIDLAMSLRGRLPAVQRALLAGEIDLYKAQLIHQMTEHLDSDDAARVGDDVLEKASRQTASEVRARARRLALRIKPKETEKAARKTAEKARDLRLSEAADGNADLVAVMAPGAAAAIWNMVNAAAWQAKKACKGDGRTIGQFRTDALYDLVFGRQTCAFDPEGRAEDPVGHRPRARLPPRPPADHAEQHEPPEPAGQAGSSVEPGGVQHK